MVKKINIFVGVLVIITALLIGCQIKLDNNSSVNDSSVVNYIHKVAASGLDCQISVYKDKFYVNRNDDNLDFSIWQNIKSVSANVSFLGGIKEDGSVVVTCYPMLELKPVSDWKDIKMLEFTAYAAIGLKNDGTIVYSTLQEVEINSNILVKINTWKDIDSIYTSDFGIVGIKRNGELVASFDYPEIEEEVYKWNNINMVSISTSGIRTRVLGLKKDGGLVEVRSDSLNKYQLDDYEKELKGAVKICAGDKFTAGLMPDGKLRVICGNDYDQIIANNDNINYADLKALDNLNDVIDINSNGDVLVVLKKDGSVLVGGIEETD